MKAIVKYPGSKWGIADWIIRFFPEHRTYLEPYFGSGAVFFNKPRSNIETINDLDGNVVNLFEWIQKDPEQLARAIYWTPYARSAYDEAVKSKPKDGLQRAVRFCVKLNQGHGFRTSDAKVGWKVDVQGRERAYAARDWASMPERILQAAERLRGVQIENRPAIELMERYNDDKVLVYLDPPYMGSTRSGRRQYEHDMMGMDEHLRLLLAARRHKGPVLISGYESEMYDCLLSGWHKEVTHSRNQAGGETRECLWMNFEPIHQLVLDGVQGVVT